MAEKSQQTGNKQHSRKLEGEGSYSATRRYNAHLKDDLSKGKTDEAADAARRALEGPEGQELKRAEEQGKRGPKQSSRNTSQR